jgi:hypothetical protein
VNSPSKKLTLFFFPPLISCPTRRESLKKKAGMNEIKPISLQKTPIKKKEKRKIQPLLPFRREKILNLPFPPLC